MKDLKEILFEQMEPSADGVELTTDGILTAMEIYAKERAVWFVLKREPKLSKFEVERLYDMFNEKEYF